MSLLQKIIFFSSVFLISACSIKNKQQISSEINTEENITTNPSSDTFAFLLFHIEKGNDRTNSFLTLKSSKKNVGKLKSNDLNQVNSNNKLSFYFYHSNKIVDSFSIEHPLYKSIEYTNDKNEFETKQLNLDSTDFFIRIQLKENYQLLKVDETFNQKTNSLLSFQLK